MNNQTLLLPKHASAADWDFSTTYWSIQTDHYVSPPSSLRFGHSAHIDTTYALCKAEGTLKLPEGRLITYFRPSWLTYYLYLLFRNTAPVGNSNINNCYRVHFRPVYDTWSLYEYSAAVPLRTWSTAFNTFDANTWRRFRLSWWLSWGILQVRLEHDEAGEWVQDGDDITVSDSLFGDQDIQRCGHGAYHYYLTRPVHVDDTEIWKYP